MTAGGVLLDSYADFREEGTPATPAAGWTRAYTKSDHGLYLKDSTGVETRLGARGSQWFTYVGTGTPAAGTFTGEADGDFCVRSADGEVFKRVSGAWVDQAYALGYAMQTAARAHATTTPATSGWTKIPVPAIDYDPGNNIQNVSIGPTVGYYVCPVAGYYQVNAQVTWGISGWTGVCAVGIYKANVLVLQGTEQYVGSSGSDYRQFAVSDMLYCAAGDTIELAGYSATGFSIVAGSLYTFLSVVKVDVGGRPGVGWRVYNGAGTPTVRGNNGDWCIRQADGEVFQMVTGVWVDQGWSLAGTNLNSTVAARAFLSAGNQSLNAGWSKVNLDARSFDPGSHFDLANHRYVCPVAGLYQVTANGQIATGTASSAGFYVSHNESTAGGTQGIYAQGYTTGSGQAVVIDASGLMQCNAGDTISLYATSPGTGAYIAAFDYGTTLSVALVAATAIQQQPLQAATQARAYRASSYTTTAATLKKLPLDTVQFDAGTCFTATTLPATLDSDATKGRYICPTGGYYQVNGILTVAEGSSDTVIPLIYVNGAEVSRGGRVNNQNTWAAVEVSDVIRCNAGDYVELWYYTTGADTVSTAGGPCSLSVSQIGTNPVAAPSYAARAYRNNTGVAPITGGWVKVPLDAISFDPSGCINLANGRYVCPVAGIYQVDANMIVNYGTAAYGEIGVAIYKNGANVSQFVTNPAMQTYAGASHSDKIQCNAGDYLELCMLAVTGNTLFINPIGNFLAVTLISQAPAPLPLTTPLVTAGGLPSSPVDGQECYFVADATNGVVWHLKYRAGSASAYKWEFVGGSSLESQIDVAETTASAAYAALATAGPNVTLPLGGDYLIEHGCYLRDNTLTAAALMSYDIGATPAADAQAVQFDAAAANAGASAARARRMTGLAAGTTLTSKYRASAGTATFALRWLNVTPVRVG